MNFISYFDKTGFVALYGMVMTAGQRIDRLDEF